MQDQCGASYAFSAIGALEGAWSLAHGKLTQLSEQNIIDCSGNLQQLILQTSCLYTRVNFLSPLQYHMEIMDARVEICIIHFSTLFPMMVLMQWIVTPSKERSDILHLIVLYTLDKERLEINLL